MLNVYEDCNVELSHMPQETDSNLVQSKELPERLVITLQTSPKCILCDIDASSCTTSTVNLKHSNHPSSLGGKVSLHLYLEDRAVLGWGGCGSTRMLVPCQ